MWSDASTFVVTITDTAATYGVACVITNQVVAQVDGGASMFGDNKKPIGVYTCNGV